MTITFQRERFAEMIAEAKPLLDVHWTEIARNKDTIRLALDFVRYAALDERESLLICTARDNGRLIGYVDYFIDRQIHYVEILWAESDVYWVDPQYRGQGIGGGLADFAEKKLKDRGVVIIHVRAKNAHPAAGRMWERLGYDAIETVYSKTLRL